MTTVQILVNMLIFAVCVYGIHRGYMYHLNRVHSAYQTTISQLKAENERVTKNYNDLLAIRQTTSHNGKAKTGQLTLIPDHMVDKTITYSYITDTKGCRYKIPMTSAVKLDSGQHYIIRHFEELTHKNRWHNGKNTKLWIEDPAKDYVYQDSFNRYWDEIIDNTLYEFVG